jgi:hypothetical protein
MSPPAPDSGHRLLLAGPAGGEPAVSPHSLPDHGRAPGFETTGFGGDVPGWQQRLRGGLKRRRFWLLVGAALIAALLVVVALRGSESGSRERLALDNPAPEGAMAAGAVLRSAGIDVRPTSSLQDTLDAVTSSGDATVLLFDDQGLLDDDQVRALAAAAPRLVLVTPSQRVLDAAGGEFTGGGSSGTRVSTVDAGCGAEGPLAAGTIDAGGKIALLYGGATVCFRPDAGGNGGLYAASGTGDAIVLGSSALLDNDRLASRGNAALAMHTLGASPVLIWYRPSPADLPVSGGPVDLASLRPAWLVPVGAWLMFVALLATMWKGRRDGPLVPEPLPVTVRATETVYGRARLYQESSAVDSAAEALRAGTLVRLARLMNLGTGATGTDVVAALAPHCNLSPAQLADLLIVFEPSTAKELVHWARQLQDLEKGTSTS